MKSRFDLLNAPAVIILFTIFMMALIGWAVRWPSGTAYAEMQIPAVATPTPGGTPFPTATPPYRRHLPVILKAGATGAPVSEQISAQDTSPSSPSATSQMP